MGGQKVAVVNDDREIIELIAMVLSDAGYEVVSAGDVASAFAVIAAERPALILLDMHIRYPTAGLDLLARLQSNPGTASLPVIFVSGEVQLLRRERERWLAQGHSILEKPFSIDILLERVRLTLAARAGEAGGLERAVGE